MDVQYPYAGGLARQRLLYHLPPVPAPRRLMLVYAERSDKALAGGWDGPVVALAASRLKSYAKHNEPSFQAIALPQVLGTPPASVRDLLAATLQLLSPGGVVMGHLDHLFTLGRLANPKGLGSWVRSAAGGGGLGTPARCLRELVSAGFMAPECYYVSPGIGSPMSLIPCRQGSERRHFIRAIRRAPDMYGRWGYPLRLTATVLGLGALQAPHLFFWAHKAC